MTSFYDLLKTDPGFKAFVEAQKGQADVELQALRIEYAHRGDVIDAQKTEIQQLRAALEQKRGKK